MCTRVKHKNLDDDTVSTHSAIYKHKNIFVDVEPYY
jgi:hypothetical protein